MKGELGGEKKTTVLMSACARLVQRVKFMFGVASPRHMMTFVPFGNERNLSNSSAGLAWISGCKRNVLQFQGIISDPRWKGFHGAQLKEMRGI